MTHIPTNIPIPNAAQRDAILRATEADVQALLTEVRTTVSDSLPRDVVAGMLLGYLRARGAPWEAAFTVMNAYLAASNRAAPRHSGTHHEMITCSVGCADYLPLCLERNMRHFDHTIVVTAPDDEASQKVAETHGASILVTDRFYRGGTRFNRGAAYNKALDILRFKDWVTFLDVDIVLDPEHRGKLNAYGLRDDVFYGADRLNVLGDEERRRFIEGEPCSPQAQATDEWGFGYLQLFNMRNRFLVDARQRGEPIYPSADTVGWSDHVFRCRFGQGHVQGPDGKWTFDTLYQQRLPWPCYHLGADGAGLPSRTIHYA